MNWAAHPYLYQVTHLWHWLTYGQNTTVLALIGLIFYTQYTRRMMVAAEETRRLSLSPYLLAELLESSNPPSFAVTNVAGPAVNCLLWMQTVSDNFELGPLLSRDKSNQVKRIPSILSTDDPFLIQLVLSAQAQRVLYVIEAHDTAGGLYQLQLLQETNLEAGPQINVENLFVSPDTFLPLWKRYAHRVWQFWNIHVRDKIFK